MDEKSNCDCCAGCLNLLDEEQYVSALGHNWHLECFRCSACDASLSSWYFEKDGLLFCRDDYWSKYGESCQQCGQIITGPVMVAGEHKFHPECFCCCSCNNFIGDGESYALVERSKLYCGQCYKRQMQPLGRGTVTHSIRLVEIPPSATTENGNGARGIRLSVDNERGAPVTPDLACRGLRISELDVSSELMSLHIGDKILEVNGTPVRDAPLENIENLIRYSDTVLQLTIEHDPDSLQRRPSYTCPVTSNKINSTNVKSQSITQNPDTSTILCKEASGNKERLFRRKDEGYMSCSRSRQLRRRQPGENNSNKKKSAGGLTEKERSSSMSRLLDGVQTPSEGPDLSRTRSFRVEPKTQRVFRGSDLVQGELLGRGFFGQVFKVTHRVTQEVMVLKELYRVDEEAQRNFLKEVAVLRSLNHVNVLRFMGVLYRDKRLHLVTEFVPGGTLRALLHDTSVVLPWEQRVTLAKDIASGMSYLHSQNIIHRDLNSHNCLVREDKTVIVADFGLARIISQPHNGSMGRTSLSPNANGSVSRRGRRQRYTVVGNPYWMAPEMMKGNKYDEKVDIFSFGIVLCEIIGRVQADPDYLPRSADFGLNQNVFKDKFCSTCPEPFYKIAFLCCDLNPDKRPPFEVLEVWLEGMSMHLSVGSKIPSSLLFDVEHYKGQSSTPHSGAQSPESGTQSPKSISKNDSNLPHSSSKEKLIKAKREAMRNRDSTTEKDDLECSVNNNGYTKTNIVCGNEDVIRILKTPGKPSSSIDTISDNIPTVSDENSKPVKLSSIKTIGQINNTTVHSLKSTPNTFSKKLSSKLKNIDSDKNSNSSELTNKDKPNLGKISLDLIKQIPDNILDRNSESYSNNIKVRLNRYKSEEPSTNLVKPKIERQISDELNSSKLNFKIGCMKSDDHNFNHKGKTPNFRTGRYVNLANITQNTDSSRGVCGSISKFEKPSNSKLGKNCVVNSKPMVLESTAL